MDKEAKKYKSVTICVELLKSENEEEED